MKASKQKPVEVSSEKPYKGMNAVLYARVSTDDKDQTTESQVREMQRWCEINEVRIIGIYEEEKSAKDLERPVFERVLGRIMLGGVNILLAWSESRISRDTSDMIRINDLIQKYETVIRYVSSSSKPESMDGAVINFFNTWQAEKERDNLSKNTINGMITASAKGVHCGRPLTFCFAHNLQNPDIKKKIRWDGKQKTRVVTIESVMDHARAGDSLETTATAIGTNRKTLSKALAEEGRLKEYKYLCSRVNPHALEAYRHHKDNNTRAEGDTGERVEYLYTNEEKPEGA